MANKKNPFDISAISSGITTQQWGQLYGCSYGLALTNFQKNHQSSLVIVTPDITTARDIAAQINFFRTNNTKDSGVLTFPDWETLPYDKFSPHEDIISSRILTLHKLLEVEKSTLVIPISAFLQRLCPKNHIKTNSANFQVGSIIEIKEVKDKLLNLGYRNATVVESHGEFATRGSIIDIFPMGYETPCRLDFVDNEIETIRSFNPLNQLTLKLCNSIQILPSYEYQINPESMKTFRRNYRNYFEKDPYNNDVYNNIENFNYAAGIEYYIPLFFDCSESIFDYISDNSIFAFIGDVDYAARVFLENVESRYQEKKDQPALQPDALYLTLQEYKKKLADKIKIHVDRFKIESSNKKDKINFSTQSLPTLNINSRAKDPLKALKKYIEEKNRRILFTAETQGSCDYIENILQDFNFNIKKHTSWDTFVKTDDRLGITVAAIKEGVNLTPLNISIVCERQLFSNRVLQIKRRGESTRDAQTILNELKDLNIGSPVVHEKHGVGRYSGLQKLKFNDIEHEFLSIKYKDDDKLYVPVSSLHLVTRYSGASSENAPLHKLGTNQWIKLKRRAAQKIADVAAELLEISTQRAVKKGYTFSLPEPEYSDFASSFEFEETLDQQKAIDCVLQDMCSIKPMDRVICGDVGFGKTEVAMRAAFIAALNGKQVAILVPTTLLAEQHYQIFLERFKKWPVQIESLSRFKSRKQQKKILENIENGTTDIVIGTHRLLQKDVEFKNLALIVVDEEQRFGVRHKEKLKSMRSAVDILTLTATPIPRTLNMSISGLRDISLITTPPENRYTIKTFVCGWENSIIKEACERELKRAGQIYVLHNQVQTIADMVKKLEKLLPNAKIQFAHGKMPKKELKTVMKDFYNNNFNVLVCTTIIENGIDIPTANTIIINRADKLGLAQLHQLRGRVGRSHHQAYAYLLTPPRSIITSDALKRIEAVESLEELGLGFTLATHDLEIRGAGELLGDEQSGQINEIGFSLYNELLERSVKALRQGQIPELDKPLEHGPEIDLNTPALIPDEYIEDVHLRLVIYKRIASEKSEDGLAMLKAELIDRFGVIPEQTRDLFSITALKIIIKPLGIRKIDIREESGEITFDDNPNINLDRLINLVKTDPQQYRMKDNNKLIINTVSGEVVEKTTLIKNLVNELCNEEQAA